MSRTKKKMIVYNTGEVIEAGEAMKIFRKIHKRKMMPYTRKPNNLKFKAYKTDHVGGLSKGVSTYDKLITKNANRALKKGRRQELKKELRMELQEIL